MTTDVPLVLWLFVVNLGLVFGAGIYEQRVVAPRWLVRRSGQATRWDAAAARLDDVGRRFWGVAATLPFTALTIASLALAWRAGSAAHAWWLAAASLAAVERLATAGYFIPVMMRLMRASGSLDDVGVATLWSRLNVLRHVLVLAAWLASLRAFELASRS